MTRRLPILIASLAGLAVAGCQCGDRAPEGAGKAGEGSGPGEVQEVPREEGVHRVLLSGNELRFDDLVVGDAKALAAAPEEGAIPELGRALRARAGIRKVLLEAEAGAEATVMRRAAETALEVEGATLVFVLPAGSHVRRFELDASAGDPPALSVRLEKEVTLVRATGGKRWTIPSHGAGDGHGHGSGDRHGHGHGGGPARDLRVLKDVIAKQKEGPLADRDDVEIAVAPGVSYGDLFEILKLAAEAGLPRPRLVAPSAATDPA